MNKTTNCLDSCSGEDSADDVNHQIQRWSRESFFWRITRCDWLKCVPLANKQDAGGRIAAAAAGKQVSGVHSISQRLLFDRIYSATKRAGRSAADQDEPD